MENENRIKFWEKKSCGTEFTREDKYSKQYYEDIENCRYSLEPEIFSFAQFPRYHGGNSIRGWVWGKNRFFTMGQVWS